MDDNLKRLREEAKIKLHSKILTAYEKFDTKKVLAMMEERIIGEFQDVTDKLLGIDRRWCEIEVKEGRIREILDPAIHKILTVRVVPLLDEYVEKTLATKTIQLAIRKAVKNRVESHLYSIEHHSSSDIGKSIDRIVQSHIDALIKEFTEMNPV